jgi:hypothetical protein
MKNGADINFDKLLRSLVLSPGEMRRRDALREKILARVLGAFGPASFGENSLNSTEIVNGQPKNE